MRVAVLTCLQVSEAQRRSRSALDLVHETAKALVNVSGVFVEAPLILRTVNYLPSEVQNLGGNLIIVARVFEEVCERSGLEQGAGAVKYFVVFAVPVAAQLNVGYLSHDDAV